MLVKVKVHWTELHCTEIVRKGQKREFDLSLMLMHFNCDHLNLVPFLANVITPSPPIQDLTAFPA